MRHSEGTRLGKRFTLDKKHGWIGGVCAGLGNYFRTDPAFFRVGFVVAAIFSPKLMIAGYVVAWFLVDER